jgi:hypothetical protein
MRVLIFSTTSAWKIFQCKNNWVRYDHKFYVVRTVQFVMKLYNDHLNPLPAYLLIYSTEQSPSWEANRFVASQEIPPVLLNPKVHYRIHNCSPPVSIVSQPNPVHKPMSHSLKIHPNIILPPTPGSPQGSLSLRFPHQNHIHASLVPIRATCPPISFLSILSPAQFCVRDVLPANVENMVSS